jgi:hypothetical protein
MRRATYGQAGTLRSSRALCGGVRNVERWSMMGYTSVLVGRDLDRYVRLREALFEFGAVFEQETNDRAIAVVGAAFLDTLLEHILLNFLVDDEKEARRLLGFDQPIGSFGTRTSTVYCLGLIGEIVRDDLRVVGRIRNRFAHDVRASFDEEPVRSWCLRLKWHEISMCMKQPAGATPREIFQVGVNQLICHLSGIVSVARMERRETPGC